MYIKLVEIPEGWGGYFCVQKMENPGRRGGGTCVNSLRGGGMDIFWNYTIRAKWPIRLISSFRSMKRLGVFLLPPGWDASQSQGSALNSPVPI